MFNIVAFAPFGQFMQLLGNTPFEIALNGALMAIIAYVAYRLLFEPAKGLIQY